MEQELKDLEESIELLINKYSTLKEENSALINQQKFLQEELLLFKDGKRSLDEHVKKLLSEKNELIKKQSESIRRLQNLYMRLENFFSRNYIKDINNIKSEHQASSLEELNRLKNINENNVYSTNPNNGISQNQQFANSDNNRLF